MPYFRENTWDASIWNNVVNNNEYGIHDPWPYNIIDIGGHIGSFSFKMLSKHNAKKVIIIEPNIDNYNLLIKNLEGYIIENKVIAINKGIGPKNTKISMPNANLGENTGGSFYTISDNGTDSITLDELIDLIDNDLPILLKLDCEGCEYEALSFSKKLYKIDCIVGEFHITNNNNIEDIKKYLFNYHFNYHYHHKCNNLGLFGAHKK